MQNSFSNPYLYNSVSLDYQRQHTAIQSCNYRSQIKGDDPQPVHQNMETTRIQSRDLSTQLPLDTILLAIDINQKLVTIYPRSKGTILNLFIKTENNYSLAVISTEFLY